jgi:outer membrane protein, multidrug efflux system
MVDTNIVDNSMIDSGMHRCDDNRAVRSFPARRPLALAVLMTVSILAFSGCTLGPNYVRPELPLPPEFDNAPAAPVDASAASTVDTAALARFWERFNDPVLTALIEKGLEANHDLRIAQSRLDEARASRRSAYIDLFPTVTASGSRQRSALAAPETPGAPPDARRNDYYEAGFDASWEISLFGRNIRGIAFRNAFADAAQAQVWGAQVAVTAEIARQYFELRGLQQRLNVARRNADTQRESLAIARARLDNGIGNDLDRARAESQYESTLAQIPQLETAAARAIYRIGVLTGQPPAAHEVALSAPYDAPPLPEVTPVGRPEDMLRRRPDIIAAERTLAGQTNLIGYRMTDLFPRITFSGRIGYAAEQLGDLGSSGSRSWRFGPGITWAAFDIPRVLQEVEAEKARTEGALAEYQQTVLEALEDAEGSLNAYGRNAAERDHRERAAKASAHAVKLARMRFEEGYSDFETVLDTERALLQSEDALTQSRVQAATSLIAVYKALGGGWINEPTEASQFSDAKIDQ